ncbi:methyltransferase domain-containing protein [Neiella litorisoli]
MKCLICDTHMHYYFSKQFDEYELGKVDYCKCPHCGFCASQSHFELSPNDWNQLNQAYHSKSHYAEDNPHNRNQRYFNQSLMLSLMTKQGLINRGDWLDWGCGVGAVSQLLNDYFDLKLSTYDKYFTPHINAIDETALLPRQFDLVVNTAVFEHVRDRDTLDEIESYVSDKGCFAIHTLVPENVPQDPNWMYLIPVHCAFHTNKSMALLMKDWGYQCSVYNQHSKMWVLFREPAAEVQPRVEQLNHALGWQYLHFKNGFMDYWQ